MNILELHYDFNLMADHVGGNDRRSFSKPEIDWLLNRAQDALMKQQVDVFELNSKKTHDLMSLHIKQPLQPGIVATLHPDRIQSPNGNIYVYELPLDTAGTLFNGLIYPYFSFTKVAATITKNGCDYRATGKYMDNDDFEEGIKSSLQLDELTLFVNIGKRVLTEGSSMYIYSLYPIKDSKVYIEYIKKPRNICIGGYIYLDGILTTEVQPELPERLHYKWVSYAVGLAFGTIGDQEYTLKKDIITNFVE